MKREIRWGLLGAGAILDRWMKGACQIDDMKIVAVASRTKETAKKMADRFAIPEAVTYEELINRSDIDIVYIPVPHQAHKELALQAMNHGKHVLVEKPATVNAADFEELVACAKKNNVFMMEAVWTRFFPIIAQIKQIIAEGRIGKVHAIQSAFSYRMDTDYKGRLYDMEQAGGGLLDVGVYNLHFARMILEKDPVALTGLASKNMDELHLEVDELASFVAQYDEGELVTMTSAIRTDMPNSAYIYGTKGYIYLPCFWKPASAQLVMDGVTEEILAPVPQNVDGVEDEGYQFEIAYVNDCIRNGVKESPEMPWSTTLSVLRQCDKLREAWGLKYPFEH